MNKETVINKLREIADSLEKGSCQLIKTDIMLSGDSSYDEIKVGVKYNDKLKSLESTGTTNLMDWPPCNHEKISI